MWLVARNGCPTPRTTFYWMMSRRCICCAQCPAVSRAAGLRLPAAQVPPGIAEVRTVEIVGLDLQADGGTHVDNTSAVGARSLPLARALFCTLTVTNPTVTMTVTAEVDW